MTAQAMIISYRKVSPLDLHLARLTEFFGVEHSMITVGEGETFGKLLLSPQNAICVMTSASTLAAIFHDDAFPRKVVARLFERLPCVLVYGVTANTQEIYAIQSLTNSLVSSVLGFDRSDHFYQVSATEKEVTHEFSGLAFGPIQKELDYGLVLSQHRPELSSLVSIDNKPIFASLKKRNSRLFLLACREIIDLKSQADGSVSGHQYFSRLVPIVMFLKYAFQDKMWHNPRRYANFIIDDPLLRKSYGYLNYARLLEEMDSSQFTTTVAFIPWNYRRTSASVAKLIKSRSDRFSVCVHGCDHTAGEFASTDVMQLHTQLRLATQRMGVHEQNTEVPYAKVMVFPQGKFSTAAFGPLKSHNYLAAVNSSPIPDDLREAHGLTVADLLTPAVSKYNSFPLFVRRYPRSVVDFAFDLFLGKPALIVEHHSYFYEGYDTIREFVTQLNSLSIKLQWSDLTEIISNTHLQRNVSNEVVECHIFSRRHIIHNQEQNRKTFVIFKHENNEIPVRRVVVNGRPNDFIIDHDLLHTSVEIPPHSVAEVVIEYKNIFQSQELVRSFKYNSTVYLRRHLSEVRDNYLCRYGGLLALLYRVKNRSSSSL